MVESGGKMAMQAQLMRMSRSILDDWQASAANQWDMPGPVPKPNGLAGLTTPLGPPPAELCAPLPMPPWPVAQPARITAVAAARINAFRVLIFINFLIWSFVG
jgi:hypothetical protein